VLEKACLCDHLGNGALISLGILKEHRAPQAICPGPNIAWFNRQYSLQEMVDHIYGRSESLVSNERPHMFAKELVMYVDYFKELIGKSEEPENEFKKLTRFKNNLENGMEYCLEIAESEAYPSENLNSIKHTVVAQKKRLSNLFEALENKVLVAG